jgi:DNA-cytosine methyltransferase
LAGGPPCQGFSYAGFRRADDIRNNLATLYLTMAKELQPETFILENVEGLLTFNGGQVIRDILKSLSDMGYKTEHAPWVLNAEEYGAPQMRRRVFIVVSKTHAIKPPVKTHLKCLGRREPIDTPITLLPDSLPYPNTSGEALHDLTPLGPVRYVENGRRPIRDSFSEWVKGFADSPI